VYGAGMSLLTYRGTVFPWHCDHMGHMNVMWYVGKFDEATWHLFASIGITRAYMRDTGHVLGAVQQNISYMKELVAGDIVEVRSRLLEIREKVIRFEHEMVNSGTGEVCARCEQTTVHIEAQTRRASAFPTGVRSAAEAAIRQERAASTPNEPAN
jgi:acyl-CoA thioester hydrolase